MLLRGDVKPEGELVSEVIYGVSLALGDVFEALHTEHAAIAV